MKFLTLLPLLRFLSFSLSLSVSLRIATYRDLLGFSRKEEKHVGSTNRDSAVIATNRRVSSIRMWLRAGKGGMRGGVQIRRSNPATETSGNREYERGPARFAGSFPYSFPRTGSRYSICAFHWVSEYRLGPMARRNADCRWGCVVFQGGRLRPAQRIRI